MSKLACPCGNIISDNTQQDSDENWGYVVRNKDWFDYQEKISSTLAGLLKSYKCGSHVEWLTDNCPVYSDQPLEGIISDILSLHDREVGDSYAKCSECGSLLVKKRSNLNIYERYQPEQT